MKAINRFLLDNNLLLSSNPCVSPDFCLDWSGLKAQLLAGDAGVKTWPLSSFATTAGKLSLCENAKGDCAWKVELAPGKDGSKVLGEGAKLPSGSWVYPATWENLLKIKNIVQEHDPKSTIFPSTGDRLGQSTIGVGARFTTLHWPAVEWAMANLGTGMTANQNSIPRELVYDVDAMLAGRLDTVPFPFIGANVPEGHQGQSVEGMSHGCVISKLKTGFHLRRIAWSFNADHQPIGGKFDVREDDLVRGCLLASYITFDLSPELAQTKIPEGAAAQEQFVKTRIKSDLVSWVKARVIKAGLNTDAEQFNKLLCYVWPSMEKMKRRDTKYKAARAAAFTTEAGRAFLSELSIDELPGLTTQETTAVMLALCEALEMKINFIAPAFGFQKNTPYPDNTALRALIKKQWDVCKAFGVSIGFHSGSGKSGENYGVMGDVTGVHLEIKTSGRYTYEMGRALASSANPADKVLWNDWYKFTLSLAVTGAFSADATEQKMARVFVTESLKGSGRDATPAFASPQACRAALEALPVSPDHMFFFEYNFLYVLAGGGRAEKKALGDHSPEGYRQRARFYAISDEGRLNFARNVAAYLIFLCETTGLTSKDVCAKASKKLQSYKTMAALLADIAPAA